jgi:glycerol uptake facilitator-like aquaporin
MAGRSEAQVRLTPTAPRRVLVAARLRALSIVCFVLYAVAQVAAAVAGWMEFLSEQRAHGSDAQLLGDQGYGWTFLEQTLQNWQSEFLALAVLVALSSVLIHRGSKHSRDATDQAMTRIKAIRRRVDALVAGQMS